MMSPRLYIDNAATSFPKPPEVLSAMRKYAETLGASAGRGAYRETLETGEILVDTRHRLARLIGTEDPNQIVFTLNGSGALNLAIKGLLRRGDHVVTTRMEHNSVLRPLHGLAARELIEVTYVAADPGTGLVDGEAVLRSIRDDTRLIVLQHASNVTGAIQPVEQVGLSSRREGIPLLVDAAQTAGHVPIDVTRMKIDLLAAPGHKGLMGPSGTGFLYIRPGLETQITPLIEGGTGSVSELPVQPDFLPDKFEAGSQNAIGLAGLQAALVWLEKKSVSSIHGHGLRLSELFLDRTAKIPGVTVYGPRRADQHVPVFSISLHGMEPAELAALFEAEFGILTRSGLHCAPFAHETIGTTAQGGTTRLSFGAYNTIDDIERCVEAIRRLTSAEAVV
jgi:cysteine desulfurase/selenocysteine lyase